MKNYTIVYSTRDKHTTQKEAYSPAPRTRNNGKVVGFRNGHKYEPSQAYLEFIAKIKKI